MQARDLAIRNGTLSVDQAVEEDGGEPPGIGRIFVFGTSVLFEPDLIQGSLHGAPGTAPQPQPAATAAAPAQDHAGARVVQQELAESRVAARREERASLGSSL